MKSILLGYDFRDDLNKGLSLSDWSEVRRESYLLRPSVSIPVSVDTQVFPSKLDRDPEDRMFLFYSRLDELRGALKRNHLSYEEGTILAVSVVLNVDYRPSRTTLDALLENKQKDESLPLDSQELGVEIGDRFFLSGLMNTGLGAERLNQQRDYWSQRINEHGLFSFDDDAEEFKTFLNVEVKEHAPFFIYGLHLVKLASEEK